MHWISACLLLAIKTAAQTAAVKEIQKTYLSQPRFALLKEAVSLAVYNYACSKTPEFHPMTGRKMSAALLATEDFNLAAIVWCNREATALQKAEEGGAQEWGGAYLLLESQSILTGR